MAILFKKEGQKYGCFSNFYYCLLNINGKQYITSEYYYQSMKTKDEKNHNMINSAPTPKIAREISRKCKIRENWGKIRDIVMRKVIADKFTQHKNLAKILISTGDEELTEFYLDYEYDGDINKFFEKLNSALEKIFQNENIMKDCFYIKGGTKDEG